MDKSKMLIMGVDIGGKGIKTGMVNSNGEILCQDSFDPNGLSGDEIVNKIGEIALKYKNSGGGYLCGIGIGAAGSIDTEKGIIIFSPNLPFKNQQIARHLKQTIGLPVYVDNDANATAKGEARFGAAKMYTHSAVVTLGTGVGVGIIKNGEIEHGTAIDTEFGHMIIDISENAEECTCLKGKKGCWECYASASALIRDTRRAMDKNRNSLMWQYVNNDINRVDGKTAFACAESGDETAKKVIENYIRYVGVGVSNLSNFGPQAVILAGGVSNQGRKLVKPVQDFVNRNLFPSAKRVDVLEAKFKTGIVGAAALVPVQKSLDKILSMEKDCIKS